MFPIGSFTNSLPNDKFSDWSKLKTFANDKLSLTEKLKFVFRRKTLWEKEKMLVTSIFYFSYNVFKSLPFQRCKKPGLCGKGLRSLEVRIMSLRVKEITLYYRIPTFNDHEGSHLKTLWQKDKMLFSNNVLYLSQSKFQFLSHIISYRLQMPSIWTSLKFYHLVKC